MLLVFGLLRFAIRRFGIPVLPLILGVILGPLMEVKLREALALSDGDISGLFNEPLAVGIYVVIAWCWWYRRCCGTSGATAIPRARKGAGEERLMTIVVGYIPNKYGQAALAAGIAEARLRGMKLVVVDASRGDALVDTRFATEDRIEELEAELAGLDGGHEIRQSDGSETGGTEVADQIIDVVRDTGASLLVIGVRHRSAIGKLFMGSTAQKLILECPSPVLAVKAQ
jgi:nucleotide-binding universal stress UspA family protein